MYVGPEVKERVTKSSRTREMQSTNDGTEMTRLMEEE